MSEVSDTQLSEDQVGKLLQINSLVYTLSPQLTVVNQRMSVIQRFERNTYDDKQRMVCVRSTGGLYTDEMNTVLRFYAQAKGGAGFVAQFSGNSGADLTGSALNFVREARSTTASGTILDYADEVGLDNNKRQVYKYPSTYFATNGTSYGWNTADPVIVNSKKEYAIPIRDILKCYDVDQLMPAPLSSGNRTEILLQDFNQALISAQAITGYTITEPTLVLDAYRLSPRIDQALRSEMVNGLEWVYTRTHHDVAHSSTAGANIQIRKAVARAKGVFSVVRAMSNVDTLANDGFKSDVITVANGAVSAGVSSYRYSLADLKFPLEKSKTPRNSFLQAQILFDKIKDRMNPGSVSVESYKALHSIVGAVLSRSSFVDDGVSTNDSRFLDLELEFADTPYARRIDTFMDYLAVCRIFPDNVVVKF